MSKGTGFRAVESMNYDFLHIFKKNYKTIPVHWGVSRFHTISLEGWEKPKIDCNDQPFTEACNVSSALFEAFIDIFKETHAFTEPEFILKSNGVLSIKIGMMDLKEFDDRIKENTTK